MSLQSEANQQKVTAGEENGGKASDDYKSHGFAALLVITAVCARVHIYAKNSYHAISVKSWIRGYGLQDG
jgi:hypothetical protein